MKLTQGQAVGGAGALGALVLLVAQIFPEDQPLYRLLALLVLVGAGIAITLFAHKSPPSPPKE
jgi:hypothetical protein